MKMLPSSEALLLVHTQSGSQYQFREYETGKWEMLRDSNHYTDKIPEKWIHLNMLPVVEQGQVMVIWLADGKRVRSTPVTFIGRNN